MIGTANLAPLPSQTASPPDDEFGVISARPIQASFGRWWDRREAALHALVGAALGWHALYLIWRVGWGFAGADPVLGALLLLVDAYSCAALGALAWFSWRRVVPVRPVPAERHRVDVYVRPDSEPEAVLRATLTGCARLAYPHTTYLVDPAGRPELAALADEYGAVYRSADVTGTARATDGELVFLLDGDQVPMPDALDALVGYFDHPDTTAVQSPHDYFNHDSAQHYSADLAPGRHAESLRFHVLDPGAARHGAGFRVGSAALIRRSALVGDTPPTGLRFHDEILVQGLAPTTLDGYLAKRRAERRTERRGRRSGPRVPGRSGARQKLTAVAARVLAAAPQVRLVALVVLAVSLCTGALPLATQPVALALLWAPTLIVDAVATAALARGFLRLGELRHFELIHGAASVSARFGRREQRTGPLYPLILICGVLALGLLARLLGAAGWPVLPPLPPIADWLVPVLAAVELRRVARTLYRVAAHGTARAEFRFPAPFSVRLSTATARVNGALLDLHSTGASLVLSRPARLGTRVRLAFAVPDTTGQSVPVAVIAEVCSVVAVPRGFRLGVRFVDLAPADRQALVEYCYVVSTFQRVRVTPVPAPRPGS